MQRSGTHGNPFFQLEQPQATPWEEVPVGFTFTLHGKEYRRVTGGCQRLIGRPPTNPIQLRRGAIVIW